METKYKIKIYMSIYHSNLYEIETYYLTTMGLIIQCFIPVYLISMCR